MGLSATATAAPARPSYEAAGLVALIVLALAVLAWRWVGYQGHDDATYATAAMAWVDQGVQIGTNHWSLRYPVVLPVALIVALTGPSIWALAAVNLVAYAAFLAGSYLAGRHWFGVPAGLLLLLIGIVLPQFPVQATYANPDLLEMAFVMGSFWLLLLARERGGAAGLLFWSGILAGFGFVTRETTLSLLLTYGLMFLFRPGMKRMRYVIAGIGFLVVVGSQSAWFAAKTGDPLYRTRISATHDRVDRAGKEADAAATGNAIDSEGVLATNPIVAPFAAIFVSQKYGLLFLLAIPAYVIVRLERRLTRHQVAILDCFGFGALASFLFVAVNATILYVVPRYFMVAAAMAAVPLAVLGASWLGQGGWRRLLAGLGIAGFVATSLALLYLENTRAPAEEQIAAYVASSPVTVFMDPELARRERYLLRVAGLSSRISTDPPPPGSIVAQANDKLVQDCATNPACPTLARTAPFMPQPGWTVVTRLEPPKRAVAPLLAMLPVRLPADLRRKIEQPGLAAVIYRTN